VGFSSDLTTHSNRPPKNCHSDRSKPTFFLLSFARANESACAVEESLFDVSRKPLTLAPIAILPSQVELELNTSLFFFCKQIRHPGYAKEKLMPYQSETPFDNIESAFEYVVQLLGATREAQTEIKAEMSRAADPEMARRKQALQLVNYKLETLSTHMLASRRILNDLRMLRRLLLEERRATDSSASA
jgi:hypothetical protein